MKDYLRELVSDAADSLEAKHIVREYLQARILAGMQRAGAFTSLAFHGGTALRFLYRIPRYSEDLDFALEREPETYDLGRFVGEVERALIAENYPLETALSEDGVVQRANLIFRGLLHELGLPAQPNERLLIKLEVDTNPPAHAGIETTIIRRYVTLHVQHHDRASLLAGKLHAILQRPYTKGRDLYDLYWYLAAPDWPAPNLPMLNRALSQSGWGGGRLSAQNWAYVVSERLGALDWDQALTDVRPFLMDPAEGDLLTRDVLERLLLRRR